MLWLSFDRPHRQIRRLHEPRLLYEVARMVGFDTEADAYRAIIAVFAALESALGDPSGKTGTAGHILAQLPSDLKRLWLDAGRQF